MASEQTRPINDDSANNITPLQLNLNDQFNTSTLEPPTKRVKVNDQFNTSTLEPPTKRVQVNPDAFINEINELKVVLLFNDENTVKSNINLLNDSINLILDKFELLTGCLKMLSCKIYESQNCVTVVKPRYIPLRHQIKNLLINSMTLKGTL